MERRVNQRFGVLFARSSVATGKERTQWRGKMASTKKTIRQFIKVQEKDRRKTRSLSSFPWGDPQQSSSFRDARIRGRSRKSDLTQWLLFFGLIRDVGVGVGVGGHDSRQRDKTHYIVSV